jgi:hypothetical protein
MALLMFGVTAMAQDGSPVVEPSVGLLASAAGLSIVIAIIMNLIRNTPLFPTPEAFNKWAPSIATLIGVFGAVVYAVTNGDPVTGESLIGAVLIGIFAGGYSQNVNTILTRTVTPAEELPE